jgi:ParG
MKRTEEPQVKRMNLNVPLELHNAFKSLTAAQGKNITDVLLEFIQHYVDKHSPSTSKPKGRRA